MTPEGDEGDEGPGTLTILAEDENGNPLGGGCYTVENSSGSYGPFCDQENDGEVQLTQVFPGENTVTEDSPPPGAGDVDDDTKSVDVGSGADEEITFVYAAAQDEEEPTQEPEDEVTPEGDDGGDEGPGTLTILAQDENGNPLGGGCYSVENASGSYGPFCDQENDGQVQLTEVFPGENSVTEDSAPPGAGDVDDDSKSVDVGSGEDEEITFVYGAPDDVEEPTAEPTEESDQGDDGDQPEGEGASLRYVRTDDSGNLLGGACIRLEGFEFRDVCDNGDGDGDPTDGVILVENLEPSDYLVTEIQSPEGTQAPESSFATVTEGPDRRVRGIQRSAGGGRGTDGRSRRPP